MALGAKSFSQRRRGPASELALFGKRLWSRWARLQPAAEVSINEAKGEAGGAGDRPRPSLPVSADFPGFFSSFRCWPSLVPFVASLEASSSSFFSDPRPQGNPELAPSHALE